MAVTVKTLATWNPVTLAAAKIALRVDTSVEDAFIEGLISAALEYCERYTQTIIAAVTLEETWDKFPCTEKATIELARYPVRSIESFEYHDENEAPQEVDDSLYWQDLKSVPARIRIKSGTLPTLHATMPAAAKITYQAGYADAGSVPASITSAMKLLIVYWFENREDTDINQNNLHVRSAHALLNFHKKY